ncbi:MAG TPA: hypothetical protein VMZ49_03560 [Patescibacteria group bacterium]|nr:hypothetical protein [Patescibacteria group bacterium]
MKQKTTVLVLLVLWAAALGLNAQEKQPPQPAAQFEISPAAGKIKIDGNQDIDLTRSDRTFFLKIGYALGM